MEFIKKIFKKAQTSILFVFGTGLLINSISWLIVRFQIKPTSETISLHYTIFYTDVKGPGYYLYAIPAVGLGICIFNFLLYRILKNRELFAAKMLLVVSAVSQIFIFISILFLKSVILI